MKGKPVHLSYTLSSCSEHHYGSVTRGLSPCLRPSADSCAATAGLSSREVGQMGPHCRTQEGSFGSVLALQYGLGTCSEHGFAASMSCLSRWSFSGVHSVSLCYRLIKEGGP